MRRSLKDELMSSSTLSESSFGVEKIRRAIAMPNSLSAGCSPLAKASTFLFTRSSIESRRPVSL